MRPTGSEAGTAGSDRRCFPAFRWVRSVVEEGRSPVSNHPRRSPSTFKERVHIPSPRTPTTSTSATRSARAAPRTGWPTRPSRPLPRPTAPSSWVATSTPSLRGRDHPRRPRRRLDAARRGSQAPAAHRGSAPRDPGSRPHRRTPRPPPDPMDQRRHHHRHRWSGVVSLHHSRAHDTSYVTTHRHNSTVTFHRRT